MKYFYCILSGACDAITGLLLLFAPEYTLQLMHVDALPAEPVYLRWVGAFVFGVGTSYFLPFLRRDDRRFAVMLEMTAWIRLVIGSFVVVAVAQRELPADWLAVTATDWTLAVAQIVMLIKGVFPREP